MKENIESVELCELKEHIGRRVLLHGAVHKIRRLRGFAFVLLRGPREVVQCVYGEGFSRFALEDLREEMCARFVGEVVEESRSRAGYEVRLLAVEVLSAPEAELPFVINNKELPASLPHLLDYRPLTLRNAQQRAIFKVQQGLADGFGAHCRAQGLTQIYTPKLVGAGAEGGANIFPVDYFGRRAYLAQSPQLYKQMMVGVFERVFEIGPVYRAEPHQTARHLNEYISMDAEIGYLRSLDQLMDFLRGLIERMFAFVGEHCAQELSLLGAALPQTANIPAVTFQQAKAILRARHGLSTEQEPDLEPEEERLLGRYARDELGADFLFVTGYPSVKRPFYALDDPELPGTTRSFDLLFRGLELVTGGLRIHTYTMQMQKLAERGMDAEPFAPYLMAHQHGLPPHGGFGMGLERATMQLLGLDNIRRAALFPRDVHRLTP